jgi:hypothetical protein
MRTKDTALLLSAFGPGARLSGVRMQKGQATLDTITAQQFAEFVAGSKGEPWIERLWNPEVRVDGTLATVWAEYDFHAGSKFSHCGTDAFQLLRTPDGWKVFSLGDTFQQEGCPKRPPP